MLLAVIGRQWYGVQPSGQRLIDDEDDWVRREIAHAIQHDVHVIPVLVNGSKLIAWELPDDIRAIVKFQYRTIGHRPADSDLAGMVDYVPYIQDLPYRYGRSELRSGLELDWTPGWKSRGDKPLHDVEPCGCSGGAKR